MHETLQKTETLFSGKGIRGLNNLCVCVFKCII